MYMLTFPPALTMAARTDKRWEAPPSTFPLCQWLATLFRQRGVLPLSTRGDSESGAWGHPSLSRVRTRSKAAAGHVHWYQLRQLQLLLSLRNKRFSVELPASKPSTRPWK